jgi:tetratricopeptide (TPR) repeat protein
LDKIGTRIAQAAALRVRMLYYLRRGDSERAERLRYQVDLHAIQAGHAWQVEWFAAPAEGMAGAAWSDMVMMRRALERIERLVEEVPTLATARDSMRMAYAFRRGEFTRAAELGERYVAEHAPQTTLGWGAAYAMIAMAYIETGRAVEARTLCENALALLTAEDRAYFALYDVLEVAYAMSLAVLGERERAEAMLDALFELRQSQGEHVILVGFYQYRARMARLVGDRPALLYALQSMRTAALSSGFPGVILLADRVAEMRAKDGQLPIPTTPANDVARGPAAEVTAISKFLRNLDTASDRSRSALQLLAGWVAADQAFLFARIGSSVQLVASLSGAAVPAKLRERVVAALAPAAAKVGVAAIEVLELQDDAQRTQRFQITLLPADGDPNIIIGAVALRECDTLFDRLPANLITDIGRVLAEDIRTDRVTAMPPAAEES